MIDPLNLVIGTTWGLVMLGSWSIVLVRHWFTWREYRDRRSAVAVLSTAGLWLTSLLFGAALMLSVLVDLFEVFGPGSLRILFGMGVGAFAGSGLLAVISGDR